MAEQTCFLCIHWKVCDARPTWLLQKIIKYPDQDAEELFCEMAKKCEDWYSDAKIKAAEEESKLLKTVVKAYQEGKAVVFHLDGGPVALLGIYDDPVEATLCQKDGNAVIVCKSR